MGICYDDVSVAVVERENLTRMLSSPDFAFAHLTRSWYLMRGEIRDE